MIVRLGDLLRALLVAGEREFSSPLILQPLVENAILHGLCGHDSKVTIEMDVAIDTGALVVRVTNSVSAERAPVPRSGIGLRNVRERLALHFGDRSQFSAGLDGPCQWQVEMRSPLPALASGSPSTEGSSE